jgi:hypothetical protein
MRTRFRWLRHCERKRSNPELTEIEGWIASSPSLLAMTEKSTACYYETTIT